MNILPLSQRVPLSVTFIGLYLGDEATQTTQTNFLVYTLNPSTSPRSLSVEFKYTMYIVLNKFTYHLQVKRRQAVNNLFHAWIIFV
jgi:hypothetical protein